MFSPEPTAATLVLGIPLPVLNEFRMVVESLGNDGFG